MRIAAAAARPFLGPAAIAARAGAYQVTGQVAEVRHSAIVVVVKGKESFEIERSPEIRATGAGAVKAGDEAAVRYRMTAASIEVVAAEKRKAR
jgi:hypothetical protein